VAGVAGFCGSDAEIGTAVMIEILS